MGLDHDANNSSSLELGLGLSLTTTTAITSEATITIPPPAGNDDNNNSLCIKPTQIMKPYSSSNFITASSNKTESEAEPSLTLGLSGDSYRQQQQQQQQQQVAAVPKNKMMDTAIGNNSNNNNNINNNKVAVYCEDPVVELTRQTSPHSVVSSFSSGSRIVVKRERPDISFDDAEIEAAERVSSRVSDEDEDGINARKKLRLTKDQSALLEESFKQHSTLNPKQKQALARQLNLRPRQVEVWFQNRRARTKLKQTEVDCEFLKKCCETLTDENRRLKKELQELKALKLSQPLYMPMSAATLSMCPCCERLNDTGPNKSSFSMAQKTHFYNPFTNPSAAC